MVYVEVLRERPYPFNYYTFFYTSVEPLIPVQALTSVFHCLLSLQSLCVCVCVFRLEPLQTKVGK